MSCQSLCVHTPAFNRRFPLGAGGLALPRQFGPKTPPKGPQHAAQAPSRGPGRPTDRPQKAENTYTERLLRTNTGANPTDPRMLHLLCKLIPQKRRTRCTPHTTANPRPGRARAPHINSPPSFPRSETVSAQHRIFAMNNSRAPLVNNVAH